MSGDLNVDRRSDGWLYLSSLSKVISGPWVPNDWVRALPDDCSDEDLGSCVREGLDSTELDIPELSSEELKKLRRPLLKLAGVSSIRRFMTDTQHVGVMRDVADALDIRPSRNAGPGRAVFLYLPEQRRVSLVPPYDDAAVGGGVRQALQRCEVDPPKSAKRSRARSEPPG